MGCSPSQGQDVGLLHLNSSGRNTELVTIINEEINEQIKQDYISRRQTSKLLLLGSSDSGKSTIVKQMKILHGGGFVAFEQKNYRYLIFRNVVEAVESLVKGAAFLEITLDDECQEKVSLFCKLALGDSTDGQMLELASEVWKSPQIQECFAQKHQLALSENVEYFLSNLQRIASDDFMPSNMDILYCRNHTSGVYCSDFTLSEKQIRLIDVGGQKSERRKWIHYFDDVTAILFVAALSGYDQVLEEDPTKNRMLDALALFDQICKSDYFLRTSIVLFLNKKDVFEQKIKKVPLTVCFTDYTGDCDYKNASAYICNRFIREHANKERGIYSHITNATDTKNIDIVFGDVIDTLLKKRMGTSGLE